MFTDPFAAEAHRRAAERKVSALTLDSFVSIHKEKRLSFLEAVLDYSIDDIRIHGLSDRDEQQIRDELDVLFGNLVVFQIDLIRYVISIYEDPDKEIEQPHFMFHTISHLKDEAKAQPRHLRLFKSRLVGFVLNNRDKDAEKSLEFVKSFITSQLQYSIEQGKFEDLLNALIGRNQLLHELEAAGFVRQIIGDDEDDDSFIDAALKRLIKVVKLGYEDLKEVVGSADTIKKLEKFYDLLYKKTGRDYFNMDRGMREKLLDKYFSSLMQFGDLKHDIILDELASFLFHSAGERQYVGGKIDKILKFLKEAETVHDKVRNSGIIITPELEKDFIALSRILISLFHYGTFDIFLPFISFRNFLETIYSTSSQLAMILHKRHGMGESIVRKQLVITFREVLGEVAEYLGDRPTEAVSYMLSILLRKPQRDMMYFLATEPSPLHQQYGDPSKEIAFLDAIKSLKDEEELWVASEILVGFYIVDKKRADKKLEKTVKKKEELTDVTVARLTFELISRAIHRFQIAWKSSGGAVLLGLKAEVELIESLKFLLDESEKPELINRTFEYGDQELTIGDELADAFDGTGYEMELSNLLRDFESINPSVVRTSKLQIAEKFGTSLVDLMNAALFVKIKPYLRGDVSEIKSTVSAIIPRLNNHVRRDTLRSREFLNDLLTFCANVSRLYFKFEAFQQILQRLIESHNVDLMMAGDIDTIVHSIRTQGRKLSPFTKAIDAIGGEIVFEKRSYLSDNQIRDLVDEMRGAARRVGEVSEKIQRMRRY